MTATTFNQASEIVLNAGFSFVSGNEAFSTFKNNNGEIALIWSNGISVSDGFTIEM
jgi:secreted trypsin-like serine protease